MFEVNGQIVPDWQYIMHNFSIAVMHRPGFRDKAKASVAARYGAGLYVDDPLKLSVDRIGWNFVDNKTLDESSSHIRDELRAGKRNLSGLTLPMERDIEAHGLFGVGNSFNAAAALVQKNNDVRYDTFLLLAHTANLVKSFARREAAPYDPAAFLAHAKTCWDESEQKGDFKKNASVPGELADCLVLLYCIARRNGIPLAARHKGAEDQVSVMAWCNQRFPGQDMTALLKAQIGEFSELCVGEGLEKHRMLNLLKIVLEDPGASNPAAACARSMACLETYAAHLGTNLQTVLDDKMTINRQRSVAQSAQRRAKKCQTINGPP
jgi:hypothetical protein